MNDTKDKNGQLLSDTERLTPIGRFVRKTSLDELPQLLNVIIGDMSLIGPRPLLVEYLSLYNAEQARRHNVRLGITGWAQVNGRNAISWEEKFRLDVWYVDNISFRLDLKILIKTVQKVFIREGINAEGEATMSKFKGIPMTKKLAIVGAGGHGKVVAELRGWEDIHFFDDSSITKKIHKKWLIKGTFNQLCSILQDYDGVIVAISNNQVRQSMLMILQKFILMHLLV